MSQLYYTPPADGAFQELKEKAIAIWETYDDTYGYATEKIGKIKTITNVGDNFMYMVAMFDSENQQKLASMLSLETRNEVAMRIKDGGAPDSHNIFLFV